MKRERERDWVRGGSHGLHKWLQKSQPSKQWRAFSFGHVWWASHGSTITPYVSWRSLPLLPFPFLSLSFSSLFLKCMQTRKLLLSTQKKIIILMMNEWPFVFKDLGKCDRDLFFLFFFFPNDFCGCGNNLFDDMDKICVI